VDHSYLKGKDPGKEKKDNYLSNYEGDVFIPSLRRCIREVILYSPKGKS